MPSYTLQYFDLQARGEIIRLIFAEAAIKYEDDRIQFQDWPKLKPDMPFGQIPVLKIDGKPLPQSGAIIRYLSREHGLNGSNSLEEAYADMLFQTLDDSIYKFPFMEKDEAAKKQKTTEALEKHVYPVFDKIEKKFKEKGGNYIINKEKMTYADLAVMNALDLVVRFDPEIRSKYPALQGLVDRIAARPKIAAYLKNRKETMF